MKLQNTFPCACCARRVESNISNAFLKLRQRVPFQKDAWQVRDMTDDALLQCALLLPIALVWVGVAFWTSCGRDAHQPGAPGYRFRCD